MKMEDCEWTEIRLPGAVARHACGDTQYIHLLSVGKRWSVFIIESRHPDVTDDPMDISNEYVSSPHRHDIEWGIEFDQREVAGGRLKTVPTAKNTAMTILAALMDGPDPEVVDEGPVGPLGVVRGGRGGPGPGGYFPQ